MVEQDGTKPPVVFEQSFPGFVLIVNTPPLVYQALAEYLNLYAARYILSLKLLFEIRRSLEEIFFIRTDPSETERLAVGDGGLAMLRTATVHT